MPIDKFFVTLRSNCVGQDNFGNKYYESKKADYLGRKKRFVIYRGKIEASKVPPLWHAWLHHLSNEVPLRGKEQNYSWQREFEPNLTGTKEAYFPDGDYRSRGGRVAVSADYKPWKPE